jgi:hypothetical protein
MSDENLFTAHCAVCGILYGLDKHVESVWRKSHKIFYCPNGHELCWNEETLEQKELKTLRIEIKDLKAKLEALSAERDAQTKTREELQMKLEVWRPNTPSSQEEEITK